MKDKLDSDDKVLVGQWITKGRTVVQDSVCDRIQWLVDSYLGQVAVDGDNWRALYKHPSDGSYWELTYPQSHMHGGGPPTLKRIPRDVAFKRYGIANE